MLIRIYVKYFFFYIYYFKNRKIYEFSEIPNFEVTINLIYKTELLNQNKFFFVWRKIINFSWLVSDIWQVRQFSSLYIKSSVTFHVQHYFIFSSNNLLCHTKVKFSFNSIKNTCWGIEPYESLNLTVINK